MRLKNVSYLAAGLLSLPVPALYAQAAADPGDRFLSVFTAFQRGENLEKTGKFAEALAAYKEASQLLNAIASEFPTWNPSIVDYRRKRLVEAITRLQDKVASGGVEEPRPSVPATSGRPPRRPGNQPPPVEVGDLPKDGVGGEFNVDGPAIPTERPSATTRPRATGSSGNPIQDLQDKMRQYEDDLRQANADKQRIQQELGVSLKRAQEAEDQLQKTEQKLKTVTVRSDTVEQALIQIKNKGAQDAEKVQVLQAEATKLKKEMRELEDQREADRELRTQQTDRFRNASTTVRSLTADNETLKKRAVEAEKKADAAIADATKKMEGAIKERDVLIAKLQKTEAERDAALLQVGQMKEAQKNVDKLVADNAQLMAKLATAEKQITQFKTDSTEKDAIIADLKKEVGAVKEQLATVQKESASYQKQMSELQARLETTNKQLSEKKTESAASATEKKRVTDENELLRNIVLRQMKKQADRDQTRKLVLGEMAKLKIKSEDLLSKIDYLGQPVVVLTPKERALFKKPQVEIGDNEISIAAAKQDGPEEAAATPEAPVNEAATPAAAPSPLTPPLPTNEAAAAPATSRPAAGATPAPLPPVTNRTPVKQPVEAPLPDLASLDLKGLNAPAPQPELPKEPTPTAAAKSEAAGSGSVTETGSSASTVPAELQPMAQTAKDEFDRGNYREAEKIYDKMLSKVPGNLYILSNLGVVRFREGKLKLAEESFRKAVAIAPEDAFSRCTLGIIYYSQSRYDDAVTELTKSLAINPRYAAAHNFLGITASQKGWQEAAQKELETAVSLDPNYADAHFNLAVVYATQQPPDKEKARKHYKRALELGADADPSLEGLLK